MVKITSKSNPLIVETAKLKSLKYRQETGLFLIEGIKVIEMALGSAQSVQKFFVDEDKEDTFLNIIEKAETNGVKIISVSSQVAQKLAFGKTTQGVFATVKMSNLKSDEANGSLIVACEDISDPGNMGTIIRTADAVGVTSIILSHGCVDVYNDKVVRASMGSLFNVKTITSDDFRNDISCLKDKGYFAACGHLEGDDFFSRKQHEKNVLIIGNEARGVSEDIRDICDGKWRLPMKGDAESLNAAVAAGIMMYDIMKDS